MRSGHDPEQRDSVDELARLIEDKAQPAGERAMNLWAAGLPGSSVPAWRELADLLRRGAELADKIADIEER